MPTSFALIISINLKCRLNLSISKRLSRHTRKNGVTSSFFIALLSFYFSLFLLLNMPSTSLSTFCAKLIGDANVMSFHSRYLPGKEENSHSAARNRQRWPLRPRSRKIGYDDSWDIQIPISTDPR